MAYLSLSLSLSLCLSILSPSLFSSKALVLRSLQAAMLLIPDIKIHFRRRLTPQKCRLLTQFDQVTEVSVTYSCSNHTKFHPQSYLSTDCLINWSANIGSTLLQLLLSIQQCQHTVKGTRQSYVQPI